MLGGSGRDPLLGISADIVRLLGSRYLGAASKHAKIHNEKEKERGTDTSDKGNTQHPTKVILSAAFVIVVYRSGHTARKGGIEQSGTCAAKRERISAELHTGDRQNCRHPTDGRMRPRRRDVTACATLSGMSLGVGPAETDL